MMRRLMGGLAIAVLGAAWLAATGAAAQSQKPASGQAGSAQPSATATTGTAAEGSPPKFTSPAREPVHEATGAEMARYYMVFLRRSGKPALPAAEGRKIMEGHLDNIRRLAGEHKLLLAGPFLEQSGPGSLAGIFILATSSVEEARQLVDTDPAVAAGRFTFEIVPWLGPKKLVRVLEP